MDEVPPGGFLGGKIDTTLRATRFRVIDTTREHAQRHPITPKIFLKENYLVRVPVAEPQMPLLVRQQSLNFAQNVLKEGKISFLKK